MSIKRRAAMRKLFKGKRKRRAAITRVVIPIPDVVRDAASAAVFLGVDKATAHARASHYYRGGMLEGELLRLVISGD